MQNSNQARATELATKFAKYMGMASWEPQDGFVEALAREIAAAMSLEEGGDVEARTDLIGALQYAAQRVEL